MRQLAFVFFGIGLAAAVAVGILVVSFDPYQAGTAVKFLFFTGSAILAASLVGILYCVVQIIINQFKKFLA